jgi:transposase
MPSLTEEEQLNNRLWLRVKPLLPKKPAHTKGGRPFVDDRACFEGIVYILRSGGRWRDLARVKDVPSMVTCWRRHRDWTKAGVWDRVWEAVIQELADAGKLDTSELYADATFVEARKGGLASALQNVGKE